MRKYILFSLISCAVLLLLLLYQILTFSDKKLHVNFCDVGQGDALHIRTPEGEDILIDGGPDEKVLECLGKYMPIWDRQIEAVYLTHPDADHLTGLIPVIKNYKVLYFGTSKAPKSTEAFEELNRQLEAKNIKINYLHRGDYLNTREGLKMTVLWPTNEFINNPSEDTNDYSLVQKLQYKNFTALLTGDVPFVYLNSIMPSVGRIDIMKLPHHGSKTGIDDFTFKFGTPKLGVISSGKNNRHGHPSKEVIDILNSNKIQYKNTATEGDIKIISDGEKWGVD